MRAGEIHALVGENGAGKSTLADVAFGALEADQGTIERLGSVGLVHQHFQLAERLRVWENVVLGREPRRGVRLDRARARERVEALAARHGLAVDVDAIVETLPVAIRGRVELLRELERDPSVLLLDEPTATLAPGEIETLFASLVRLAGCGVAILIITHKLDEVITYAERVTVMRNGKIAARMATAGASLEAIARAMVGGEIPRVAQRIPTVPRACVTLRGVTTFDEPFAARGIDLDVRAGEIVGIAGVEGNGQTALADAVAGIIPHGGTIEIEGERGVIPQDRRAEALVHRWSIAENVALGRQRTRFRRGLLFDRAAMRSDARAIVERFAVRPADPNARIETLSGGNQQKVVVGRALADDPAFILAYQPTRGIDVGAAALVQSRLIEARNGGCAILLISFDLDEIFTLADRIAVMFRGRLTELWEREAVDRARIGAVMAGGR